MDAIKKIKKSGRFDALDSKLKYVAMLREKYPDKSLSYIAEKTSKENKLTKSGIKHRLDKLIEISKDL